MRLCEYNDSLIHIPTQELVRERFTVSTIHNDDEAWSIFCCLALDGCGKPLWNRRQMCGTLSPAL